MAAYDSPGFEDQLPAFSPRSSHDYMPPPGSAGIGTDRNDLGTLATVIVTGPGGSSTGVPQPTARVDAGDTGVPSQTDSLGPDGLCGSGLSAGHVMDQTNAGRGRVVTPHHPNSNGVNP